MLHEEQQVTNHLLRSPRPYNVPHYYIFKEKHVLDLAWKMCLTCSASKIPYPTVQVHWALQGGVGGCAWGLREVDEITSQQKHSSQQNGHVRECTIYVTVCPGLLQILPRFFSYTPCPYGTRRYVATVRRSMCNTCTWCEALLRGLMSTLLL